MSFYTPEQICRVLSDITKASITPTGNNTGVFVMPIVKKGFFGASKKRVKVGWMFSPEDYSEVKDSDMFIFFMEPQGEVVQLENGYSFLPDPRMVIGDETGLWARFIRYFIGSHTTKGKNNFVFLTPNILEDFTG